MDRIFPFQQGWQWDGGGREDLAPHPPRRPRPVSPLSPVASSFCFPLRQTQDLAPLLLLRVPIFRRISISSSEINPSLPSPPQNQLLIPPSLDLINQLLTKMMCPKNRLHKVLERTLLSFPSGNPLEGPLQKLLPKGRNFLLI